MSDQEGRMEAAGVEPIVRSGVKIEMNAKGMAQVKVAVYEGTTVEAMEEAKTLALRTYEVTCRALGVANPLVGQRPAG